MGKSFVQLETKSAVLIAAGDARPGMAMGGGGNVVDPVKDSLSGLLFELLLPGRGDGCG